MTRPIKCPTCGKPTLFTAENPARPFCSERCKLIDLGSWADGSYAIPVKPAAGKDSQTELEDFAAHETRKGAASGENPSLH